MNIRIRKSLLTTGLLCVSLLATASAGSNNKKGKKVETNPLMSPSTLPYGAPNFNVIKNAHYLPAIKAGVQQQREEIMRIVSNKQKPTFANTVLAYEKSGRLLNRVTSIFFGLTNADKTPDLEEAENTAIPLLTSFDNEVMFNQKLREFGIRKSL